MTPRKPATEPTYEIIPTATATPVISPSNLFVFLDVAEGTQLQPAVFLTALQEYPDGSTIEIRGMLNYNQGFICQGSRCAIPISRDSFITFKAYSSRGVVSNELNATIRVNLEDGVYRLRISALTPLSTFADSCAEIWNLKGGSMPDWAIFPQSPIYLSTDKNLQYLASQLIANGLVDVSSCGTGFVVREGPNACQLELAASAIREWQNHYDLNIWLAARDIGVPPVVLKYLIEVESQYWPGNSRNFFNEFGLAQTSEQGADVVLRWDKDYYEDTCPSVLEDCSKPYVRLPSELRAMLRGFTVQSLNAECYNCPYSVDLTKARKSITNIARILVSNCVEAKYILDLYHYSVTYEDYWKFTMASYHSGYQCVNDAVKNGAQLSVERNWQTASIYFDCPDSREYVERFWGTLSEFEANRLPPEKQGFEELQPVLQATLTPVPSPTPRLSKAKVTVRVYIDSNGDGVPQDNELLDRVLVKVELETGIVLTAETLNGEAVFDMTGYPIGMKVTVSLPAFYRSYSLFLPEKGLAPVVFQFTQPAFPTTAP